MSKVKKCTSSECRRFDRSQKMHVRLSNKYLSKIKKKGDRNHRLGMYHADVYDWQNATGCVATKKQKSIVYYERVKKGLVL